MWVRVGEYSLVLVKLGEAAGLEDGGGLCECFLLLGMEH